MKNNISNVSPKVFVLDVDGVMTTGQFFYTSEGKVMKVFGPDDNDALSLLKPYLKIIFVSADARGFNISKSRIIDDMKYSLELVKSFDRLEWLSNRFNLDEVVYMGDGIFDHHIMRKVAYSIAPNNADVNAKKYANYVTHRNGGDRAVAEACLHLLNVFFEPYDLEKGNDYMLSNI